VRMLADPINVVYDARDRMLVEYHGVSNLRDANLKNYKVSIHFPMDERVARTGIAARPVRVSLPDEQTGSLLLTSAE
ncbi:MAG: hypothetical protein AAGA95_16610, partial [Pseudomonadota bacterium]